MRADLSIANTPSEAARRSTDISGRPRSATIVNLTGNQATPGTIDLADLFSDVSTVFVRTANVNGVDSVRPFVLIIY